MSSDPEMIKRLLSEGKKVFFLHSNADLDCVGASAALALHFGDSVLCAPQGVSHLGKKLLERIGIEPHDGMEGLAGMRPVVVDARNASSIGHDGVSWEDAIVIDHHGGGELRALAALIDETATSSCELAWEVMGKPDGISSDVGICLMAGLLADTGRLSRGNARTLLNAAGILNSSGLKMEDLQDAFDPADDQDISRRISRLKGAQRLRFERVGEWMVATSEIGAFESAVCHALLSVGADVAFVGSGKDGGFRVAGRAGRHALDAGLRLGDILSDIASECGGEGGGHDGAAGLSGEGEVEAMLNICSARATAFLKGRARLAPDRKHIIRNGD